MMLRQVRWAAVAFICAVPAVAAEAIQVRSEAGHFIIRVTGIERPEPINHLHGFDLSLATADGRPAAGATIVVTGERRYALNPLPTAPRVSSAQAEGQYRVEGLRFHMAGEWQLDFAVSLGEIRDRASLDVVVK
jgi:hypothetical protein